MDSALSVQETVTAILIVLVTSDVHKETVLVARRLYLAALGVQIVTACASMIMTIVSVVALFET